MIEARRDHWAVDRYPAKFLPEIRVHRRDIAESAQNLGRSSVETETVEQVVRAVAAPSADDRSRIRSQRLRLSAHCSAPRPGQQKSHAGRAPGRDLTSAHSLAAPAHRSPSLRAPLPPDLKAKERGWYRLIAARVASEAGACGAIENKEFWEASPEARCKAFTYEQQCAARRRSVRRARAI